MRPAAFARTTQASSSLTVQQESAPCDDRALPDIDHCPSCSSTSSSVLFSTRDRLRGQPGNFEVLECADCRLTRIRPALTQSVATPNLEWIRDDEPSTVVRRLINWPRQLAARRLARVIRGCAGGGTVLDLGGVALLGLALRRRGLAVGLSCSDGACGELAFLIVWDIGSTEQAARGCFLPGSFDVIVAKHVLEHERDPRVAVVAMLEMLAPGGSLVIEVPNANSWQALLLAGAWEGFDIPRHPVSFDDTSLGRLLESCGLVVASSRTGSVIEAAFSLATSLCPWLTRLSVRSEACGNTASSKGSRISSIASSQ